MLCGLERRGGEGARVDTALLQIKSGAIGIGDGWVEVRQRRGKWRRLPRYLLEVIGGGKENCALISEINLDAGFKFQLANELGIHARAGCGQGLQGGGGFEQAIDQHAAGGVRCFAAGLAALDHEDARAFSLERDQKRESDDAAADDDYVPGLLHLLYILLHMLLHICIVKDGVTFVTGGGTIRLRGVTFAPPIIRSTSKDNDGERKAESECGSGNGVAMGLWSVDIRSVARSDGGMWSVVRATLADFLFFNRFERARLGSSVLCAGAVFQLSALHGDDLPRLPPRGRFQ